MYTTPFINGSAIEVPAAALTDVINPANQKPFAKVFMGQVGGVKDSGNGSEGGRWSMEELTETKWITIQLGQRHYPF
jgi:hypothetical protein